MKALSFRFNPQLHTDERVRTHLVDRAPKCKELSRGDKRARLLKEVSRKTGPAKHIGNRNPQLIQLYGETSWNAEVFEHHGLLL
jgi:hypothetical protein